MIGLGNKMTTGGKIVTSVPDQNYIATVSVETVADPGETTFTLDGSYVSAIAVTNVGFQYSENSDMSSPTAVNATLANPFTADVTGLTAATTYYYRAFATNADGTAYSETKSLTTDAAAQESPSGFTAVYEATSFPDSDIWSTSGAFATLTAGESYTIGGTTYTNLMKLKQNDEVESLLYLFDSNFWASNGLTYSLSDTIAEGDVKVTMEYIYDLNNDQTNSIERINSGSTTPSAGYTPTNPNAFDTLHNETFEIGKTSGGVFLGFYFENELENFVSPGDIVYIKSIKVEVRD